MKKLIQISLVVAAFVAVAGLSSCTSTDSNPHAKDYHNQKHGG